MKKRVWQWLLLGLLAAALLTACANNRPAPSEPSEPAESSEPSEPVSETMPRGVFYQVDGLPSPEEFPDGQAGSGITVLSASLRRGEVVTPIASDDKRLIRLLNILLYSYDGGLSWLRQGLVESEEIAQLSEDAPAVLEIDLQPAPEGGEIARNTLNSAPKILVFDEKYLVYMDPADPGYAWAEGAALAEEHYPFGEHIAEKNKDFLTSSWEGPWIDILTYAGF